MTFKDILLETISGKKNEFFLPQLIIFFLWNRTKILFLISFDVERKSEIQILKSLTVVYFHSLLFYLEPYQYLN